MNKQQAINFLDSIVFSRFQDLQELQAKLKDLFQVSVPLEQVYYEESYDNNLIGTIDREDLFIDIDIYYLKDNKDNYLITEVSYSFEEE